MKRNRLLLLLVFVVISFYASGCMNNVSENVNRKDLNLREDSLRASGSSNRPLLACGVNDASRKRARELLKNRRPRSNKNPLFRVKSKNKRVISYIRRKKRRMKRHELTPKALEYLRRQKKVYYAKLLDLKKKYANKPSLFRKESRKLKKSLIRSDYWKMK